MTPYHHNARHPPPSRQSPERPAPAVRSPLHLILIAIIAVCVVVLVVLALAWPFARTLAGAFDRALVDDVAFTSFVIRAFLVLLLLGFAGIVFAFARRLRNSAEMAGIVRFQNEQPIHIRQLRRVQQTEIVELTRAGVDRHYDVAAIAAAHSDLARATTYSPSIAYHYTNKQDGQQPPALGSGGAAPIAFDRQRTILEQLRERGEICRSGHSLLIGHTAAGEPQYIELKNAGFIAVAGQPRVGKTTTVKLLLAQAALMGWNIVLCDPQGLHEQGLFSQCELISGCMSRVAITPAEIADAISYVYRCGQQREALGASPTRMLIVFDEFTRTVLDKQVSQDALGLLISMAVAFPKLHINGVLIGHSWTARLLGPMGASLRQAVTHRVVHRSDPKEAEFLLPAALASRVAALPPGQALYWGDYGDQVVAVPCIGADDMRYAGQGRPVKPYNAHQRSLPAAAPAIAAPAQVPPTVPLPQPTHREQVIGLLVSSGRELDAIEIAQSLSLDRQYVFSLLSEMVKESEITRRGGRRNYRYSAS